MGFVGMTCEMDSASLRQLTTEIFPQLLAAGRRTMEEQCVTSATFVAKNAKNGMAFVLIATIDRELEEAIIPRTRKTAPKSETSKFKSKLAPLPWTVGMLIAVMRTQPKSPYSIAIGNQWPLAKPTGKRGSIENWRYFVNAAERMQSARHSSTHFLLTGWTHAIRDGLASPLYRYNASFGSRRDASAVGNAGADGFKKAGDVRTLGRMDIELSGDDCMVTTSNDVGGEGNEVLAKKYREALIEHGTGPLEDAIGQELADGEKELQTRFLMKTQGLSRQMVKILYF